jgi:hypothetical protein
MLQTLLVNVAKRKGTKALLFHGRVLTKPIEVNTPFSARVVLLGFFSV